MKKLALALSILALMCGCSSRAPSTVIVVAVAPAVPPSIDQGQTLQFTASLADDKTSAGVAWSATGPGCGGLACGTFTNVTPTSATYVAPASVSASLSVTVTGTSVAQPTQTSSSTFNVMPPPSIITTNLPTATPNYVYNTALTATGGVPPLKWNLAAGALPVGMSLNSAGTIYGTPTTGATSTFTLKVTDSSGAPGGTLSMQQTFSLTVVGILTVPAASLPNGTVGTAAGTYEMRRFNTYFFDSQLEIRESIIKNAAQVGDSIGDLQADEVSGALQDKAIKFSQQFYQGLALNPNGFFGLKDYLQIFNGLATGYQGVIDSRTGKKLVNFIDANPGSNNPACECIWYIWAHPQGIHFLYGGDSMIDVNPWVWAYLGASNARYRAQVSNINGFVGLSAANPWCVAVIKNVDAAHPWTDALSSKLHALLPVGIAPTHCFATKRARALLQQQRTVTLFGQAGLKRTGGSEDALLAPVPQTDVEGIPITVTDGIQLGAAF